jgi:Nickel responsive protein SCO4226-like
VAERASTDQYVVECFWSGVDEAAVREVDARAARSTAELTAAGEPVRYLGSLLVREDETVFCLFEGPKQTVQKAAEQAQIPFERILEATRSPWPLAETP